VETEGTAPVSSTMKISISHSRNAVKVFSDDYWKKLNRQLIEEEQEIIEEMFMDTTSNWDNPPRFTKQVNVVSGGVAGGWIQSTSKPFVWVVLGTKKRYMKMQPSYHSKSIPGKLGTYGHGGPEADMDFGRKGSAQRARGRRIKARRFHWLIANKRNRVSEKGSFSRKARAEYVFGLREGLAGATVLPYKSKITRGKGKVTWI